MTTFHFRFRDPMTQLESLAFPILVGMGDLVVSSDRSAALVTHALGSSVAVTVYDRVKKVGGMVHYMLPEATTPEKAHERPALFANSGLPTLLRAMYERSCRESDLSVKLIGGASISDRYGALDIGRRNYTTARELLQRAGIAIAAEDVGGRSSRSVRLCIDNGRTSVHAGACGPGVEL